MREWSLRRFARGMVRDAEKSSTGMAFGEMPYLARRCFDGHSKESTRRLIVEHMSALVPGYRVVVVTLILWNPEDLGEYCHKALIQVVVPPQPNK